MVLADQQVNLVHQQQSADLKLDLVSFEGPVVLADQQVNLVLPRAVARQAAAAHGRLDEPEPVRVHALREALPNKARCSRCTSI